MSKNDNYGIFVHGLHKSASMFLYKLFRDLAEEASVDYYSSNYKLGESDKLQPNQKELRRVTKSSFCYCPVRHFALSPEEMPPQKSQWGDRPFIVTDNFPNISQIYRIYHIRDPRDILVSQYFSFGFIHSGKKNMTPMKQKIQKMTIDEYVLEYADQLLEKYKNIIDIVTANNPNYLIVKYETMVLNYRDWLAQVIKVFEFQAPEEEILEKYYQKYKQEFDTEGFKESLKHKRKMIPGDHTEKLRPSTIELLNKKFATILEQFYDLNLELVSSTR